MLRHSVLSLLVRRKVEVAFLNRTFKQLGFGAIVRLFTLSQLLLNNTIKEAKIEI